MIEAHIDQFQPHMKNSGNGKKNGESQGTVSEYRPVKTEIPSVFAANPELDFIYLSGLPDVVGAFELGTVWSDLRGVTLTKRL
ncbi:hypothetical protein [Natrinema halophilum]|uniref:Uncharacterized protein n=1 Tax=Natrinema halophilum TaxID=1699371 RepID=A0A7D5KJU4_9EURY|nr:hypothetical protein [Natrinema halophilum]QLG48478.1 hypothetical protein HYG82_06265 [Natrinema halophilum]